MTGDFTSLYAKSPSHSSKAEFVTKSLRASRKCLPGNHEPALPPCRKPPLSRAEGVRLDGKSPHRRWLGISPYSLVPSPCSLSYAPPPKKNTNTPSQLSHTTA